MQLALGAITSLFGGGAAAAGAGAAGAATGLATAAGGSSGVLSILQGAASVAGVLATIGAGNAQAESYKAQAFHSDMEAKNEEAQGLQRTTQLKRELLKIVGESDVNYAAAGIDISTGVAAEARATAEDRASQEISIDRSTTDARAAMARLQAASYRSLAQSAKSNALFSGLASAFQAFA